MYTKRVQGTRGLDIKSMYPTNSIRYYSEIEQILHDFSSFKFTTQLKVPKQYTLPDEENTL